MKHIQNKENKVVINRRFKCAALMAIGVMVAGVPMETMAAEKHTGTVVRGAKHSGSTAPKPFMPDGACTIDLTVPETTGNCELGSNDDGAKLVIKGWYAEDATGIKDVMNSVRSHLKNASKRPSASKYLYKMIDREAKDLFRKAKHSHDGIGFWGAHLLVMSKGYLIDPVAGQTKKWESLAYTKAELEQARRTAVQWAAAWQRYRGNKFGK